ALRLLRLRLRARGLPAAAEREVHVDPLHELLALYAKQGRACGIECELLLLNRAQVSRANAVAHVCEFECALVLRDRLAQHRGARLQGEFGSERVLDLAERALADAAVLRHRDLLVRGLDLDLGLERTAGEY